MVNTLFERVKELFFQAELKERLTPTQYLVTQEHQTEKYKKLVNEIECLELIHFISVGYYSPQKVVLILTFSRRQFSNKYYKHREKGVYTCVVCSIQHFSRYLCIT